MGQRGWPGCKITNAINRQVISADMKAVHAAGDRSIKQTRSCTLDLGHQSNKKPAASNKKQNTLQVCVDIRYAFARHLSLLKRLTCIACNSRKCLWCLNLIYYLDVTEFFNYTKSSAVDKWRVCIMLYIKTVKPQNKLEKF